MKIMHRTFHFGLAIVLALSFTLTACDSGSDEEEGADTDPAIGCDDAGAITIQVPPRATSPRASPPDRATPAQPSRLADLGDGLEPGTAVRVQRLGEYQYRDIHPDSVRYRMVAVFSSDDTLLEKTERARVPSAIDAGEDYVTRPSHRDDGATDIPEDFAIFDSETVVVPEGAEYIFVSAEDDRFGDNLDEDNDFRLCITPVES
jgi:hypothetical protein